MTKENKELLLQDLCARLPYGVICDIYNEISTIKEKLLFGGIAHFADDSICVKPYLRSLASMTDEERNEYNEYLFYGSSIGLVSNTATAYELIDWLNAHHFDYRGLIEKGLAIEVTENNNPYV
jgi:hypothetical protein